MTVSGFLIATVTPFIYAIYFFACALFCVVYYLKATFGPGTGDALLEIPVSITGNNGYLEFNSQISSSKIELVALQVKAGNTEALKALEDTDEYVVDGRRGFKYALDSDADAIQIVAKKTGITTNIEFVLIDLVAVRSDLETGNIREINVHSFNYTTVAL